MFLAQSLNFPSEKRLKSTGFSEAGRILSIRPDKDTNEIWARCGHDGQKPLSIILFFSLSWNQSGLRYSFECGWLTVWMFAALWCWEEMCSVTHSQHTIKGSFVSLWTKYRVVSSNNKMRVVTSEGWNSWPMGEDGQFTLWALQEESEKKPHTLLGWHAAVCQCKQRDAPLGSFYLFWIYIKEKVNFLK